MYTRRQFGAWGGVVLVGSSGCNGLLPASSGDEDDEGSRRLLVASDGNEEIVLLRHRYVAEVHEVLDEEENHGTYAVPVELTDEGEDSLYEGLAELDAADDPGDVELSTYHRGEVVFTAGITAAVAERPDNGADSSAFRIAVPDRETAEELRADLEG